MQELRQLVDSTVDLLRGDPYFWDGHPIPVESIWNPDSIQIITAGSARLQIGALVDIESATAEPRVNLDPPILDVILRVLCLENLNLNKDNSKTVDDAAIASARSLVNSTLPSCTGATELLGITGGGPADLPAGLEPDGLYGIMITRVRARLTTATGPASAAAPTITQGTGHITISTTDTAAAIYYSLDGKLPSLSAGQLYVRPIPKPPVGTEIIARSFVRSKRASHTSHTVT